MEAAARATGLKCWSINASTSREIDAAFATFSREARCPLRRGRSFLQWPACPVAQLAASPAPALYLRLRDYAEAGRLMSYGPSITDALHQLASSPAHP